MAHQIGHYFYRTWRQGGRMVREYLGRGELGEALAVLEAIEQEERQEQREAWRAEKKRQREVDQTIDRAGALLRELVSVTLRANGYHHHKGQWRQRKYKEMGGELVEAKTGETLQLWHEFRDLLERANRPDARPEEGTEARRFLEEHPQVKPLFLQMWQMCPELDMAHQAALHVIRKAHYTEGARICWEGNFEVLQRELAQPGDGPMEQMLIRHVALCWLRLQLVDRAYTNVTSDSIPIERADFWERRLSATQRRYLRACEAVVRVRRLKLPPVQVNIGEQQLNQVNVKR